MICGTVVGIRWVELPKQETDARNPTQHLPWTIWICHQGQCQYLIHSCVDWLINSIALLKYEKLKEVGITHIVCVRQAEEARLIRPIFPDRFTYLVLDIADHPTQQIIPFFSQVSFKFTKILLLNLSVVQTVHQWLSPIRWEGFDSWKFRSIEKCCFTCILHHGNSFMVINFFLILLLITLLIKVSFFCSSFFY